MAQNPSLEPRGDRWVYAVAYTFRGALLWCLLVLLTRLPLIGGIFPDHPGISTDSDAPGVAITALKLWHEGVYTPSRPPGYFLSEIINALFYPLGWWSADLFWSVVYGLSCVVYARLLLTLHIPHGFWVLTAYSFFPLMVVENASISEYTLSNTLLVLGWYALVRDQPLWSGLWVGSAVAARVSQTVVALPVFALALWARSKRWQSGVLFLGVALLIAVALWLAPMRWLTGGWAFLAGGVWQGSLWWRILGIGYDLYRAFGLLGMILSLLYVVGGLPHLIRLLRQEPWNIPFWMCALSLLIIVLQPNKPGYALIMVPFLYPLLASFRSLIPLSWVVIATVSFLVVALPYVQFRGDGVDFRWVGAGKIQQELTLRQREWRIARRLTQNPPERSMVLMGHRLYVTYLLTLTRYQRQGSPFRTRRGHVYLEATDTWLVGFPRQFWRGVSGTDPRAGEHFLQSLARQGYRVYYLPDMGYLYENIPGLLENAQPLVLSDE